MAVPVAGIIPQAHNCNREIYGAFTRLCGSQSNRLRNAGRAGILGPPSPGLKGRGSVPRWPKKPVSPFPGPMYEQSEAQAGGQFRPAPTGCLCGSFAYTRAPARTRQDARTAGRRPRRRTSGAWEHSVRSCGRHLAPGLTLGTPILPASALSLRLRSKTRSDSVPRRTYPAARVLIDPVPRRGRDQQVTVWVSPAHSDLVATARNTAWFGGSAPAAWSRHTR